MDALRNRRGWRNWRRCTNRGFTLIELVIVLALTMILAGGVVFSFRGLEQRSLHHASLELQADLRYAQRMAMIESRRYGVQFDIVNNQYHVYATNPRRVERTVALPNGVTLLETSHGSYEYLPRGTGSSGLRVTLIKGRYQQQLTATVSGGRILVKDILIQAQ